MFKRILDSRNIYGKAISENIWEDSNGYLVCKNAILARTGSYDYLESEIKPDGDPNKIVKVYREEREVFSPAALASFENVPVTDDHPSEDVTPNNYSRYAIGFLRDVRRGEGELVNDVLGDVVITDPIAIEKVKSGRKRELSLGYDTNIVERDGKYYMTNIIGNHLALVNSGRAGCATIRDRAISSIGGKEMSRKTKITLFDDDIYEVEEITEDCDTIDCNSKDGDEVEEKFFKKEQFQDEEDFKEEVFVRLDKILRILEEKLLPKSASDSDEVEAQISNDLEEEKVEEEKTESEVLEDTKPIKDTYARFAKVGDSKAVNVHEEVNQSFASRYAKAAGIK